MTEKEKGQLITFLGSVNIFSLLSKKEIAEIVPLLQVKRVEHGKTLFQQGDKGNTMYIVKSGKVGVSIKLPGGMEKEIVQFGAGDFFGEMSIFDQSPRSATCRMLETSELIVLPGKKFITAINANPSSAIKIMFKMLNNTTHRLLNSNKFLSDMVHWGEDARKRAITDDMTGLFNRRYLEDTLPVKFDEARRSRTPVSLVMVDLDYFRQINEQYSHEVGDQTIHAISKVFTEKFSDTDIVSRYGGDEFTIILPGRTLHETMKIASAVCSAVRKLDTLSSLDGEVKKLSLSMGASCYPETAASLESLKEQADQSLYRAKEEGRDRVVCFEL
jgi:diguanylate cyclase (GGDEF)-like protein